MAEAAAAFVVKGLALKGAEAAVVAAIVEVAVTAAAYAGAAAITRQNNKEKEQGGLIDLQLNSAAPRQMVIGKRMTGGVLIDWYLAGSNNTKLYLPVYLSEGPCGQVTRVFADGREVWATPLVHGTRTTIPDFRSGGDRLWLTYYDGRVGQTADATLVALGQGWTSANKMTGCAWVLIECQWDSDNMRSPPSLSFEMEGAKLYDRRKDTTAGGSGSHRANDPATWEFSDNPAVALDHFMLGRYWSGARTFGIGLSADEVPYSYFAAQANVCDEDVDLNAGGTQKRYRANGFIFANEDYAATITKLCTAMAARPADFGGRFGVIGVESKTPVMTIDDGDLIAGVNEVYTPKRSWAALVGEIEGRFQDPAQLYQPTPYPNVTDATWEAEDGGEPKLITHDLEFETNVERAQRLALLKARAERRQATLRGVYPLWTVELERGDWFIRTGPKWGGGGKTFEVIERVLNPETWTVTIVSQEVDAADSAWDESTAADGPPAPLGPTDTLSDVTAPSLTVTSNPIVGAASNTPAIKIAFTNPTDPRVNTMFVEVYRNSDGLKVATAPVTIPDDDGEVIIQNGIADGVLYDVRAKYLTPGLSSAWSTVVSVTTGATYAVGTATNVPAGSNGLVDTGFRFQTTYWTKDSITGSTTFSAPVSTGGLRKSVVTGAGLTVGSGNYVRQTSVAQQTAFQCKAGDVVGARILAGGDNISQLDLYIAFRNAAGTAVGFSTLVSVSSGILTGNGEETDFNELTSVATAPAGTVVATIDIRGIASTSAPVLRVAKPLLARLPAGQTVAPLFHPGRDHELGANITETRTAAAITGQGSLATISRANVVSLSGSEAINNALVPVGANGLVDTGFRFQTTYWTKTQISGSTTWSASETTEGLRVGVLTGSGVTVNGTDYILGGSQLQRTSFPCKAGDTVGVRVLVGSTNASSVQLRIMFRNAAGTLINSALVSLSSGLLAGTGDETTFNEMTTSGVAGAGALTVNFEVRAIASTSAPILRLAKPMLTLMPTSQTAIPAYAPGREHEIGANQTETRVAAAITGQGNQATASMTRGNTASRPATPADWSTHSNTETGKLEMYTTGTGWVVIATLSEPLSVTRTNGFVKTKIGAGTNTTDSVSFSGAGGSGAGYTFAHEMFLAYTTGPTPSLSSASGSPITASATGGVVGDEARGFVSTTVTDSLGAKAVLLSPLAQFWDP